MSSNPTQPDLTEKENIPLYSGMIVRNYIEYVNLNYPEVDIDSILDYSGIKRYQIDDQGHWFNQQQVDLFQETLIQKTGDLNIAREVGRNVNTSKAWSIIKQYLLGFITLVIAYMMMEKLYPRLSRPCDIHVKKLKRNKVEVVVTPKPNVEEKPYQCENRWGTFEVMTQPFTKKLAIIEHPTCIHKGGDSAAISLTGKRARLLCGDKSAVIQFLSALYCFLCSFLPSQEHTG
jgi:hypothetical protein